MASNSHVIVDLPKIKLVQDFIAVLITCKSDERRFDQNEIAIIRTAFPKVYEALMGG